MDYPIAFLFVGQSAETLCRAVVWALYQRALIFIIKA